MDTKIAPAKIVIGKEVEESLIRMVQQTNDGFSGGRITKNELACWIILQFENTYFKAAVTDIRKAHFDKVVYLSSLVEELKKAKRDGSPEPNLNELLAPLSVKNS
ncbi:MAG: hypothetical protein HY537_00790 [Deltaproteobacteria bacterium]|nr:hypothetical protein [Deltaproteobacteria bacterium]